MLKRIKQHTLKTWKRAGVFALVANSRWRKRRLLILAYHGISLEDEHEWDGALFMSPESLAARFNTIKKGGYAVLPLDEAVRALYAGSLPDKAVAITFDDGNYDFYKQALPLVEQFGFPVTVYLTTYYSGYNKPVFGVTCSYLLWKARDRELDLRAVIGEDARFDLSAEPNRATAHRLIVGFAARRNLSAEEKNDLLAQLAARLHIDYGELLSKRILHLMTANEAADVAARGVDVQLHTHRHRTPDDRSLFEREIDDNRRAIEQTTGRQAIHFCYPSGVYKPQFLPWLADMGVSTATTCDASLSSRSSNRLLLPRIIDTSNLSPIEFEGWLTGVSAVLPQRS